MSPKTSTTYIRDNIILTRSARIQTPRASLAKKHKVVHIVCMSKCHIIADDNINYANYLCVPARFVCCDSATNRAHHARQPQSHLHLSDLRAKMLSALETYYNATMFEEAAHHLVAARCDGTAWRRWMSTRAASARHDLISASSLASDVNRYDVLYMNRMLRVCCIYSMGIQPGILVARIQLRLYELATVCTQRLGSGVLYARIVNVLIHFGTADAQSTRACTLYSGQVGESARQLIKKCTRDADRTWSFARRARFFFGGTTTSLKGMGDHSCLSLIVNAEQCAG